MPVLLPVLPDPYFPARLFLLSFFPSSQSRIGNLFSCRRAGKDHRHLSGPVSPFGEANRPLFFWLLGGGGFVICKTEREVLPFSERLPFFTIIQMAPVFAMQIVLACRGHTSEPIQDLQVRRLDGYFFVRRRQIFSGP